MIERVRNEIRAAREVCDKMLADEGLQRQVANIARVCVEAFRTGGKVLLAGNGGSAADAQHLAGEFVSRFAFDRPGLPAIALTTDTSVITAISNDYGYEKVFGRQIQALGNTGDVFIAISTSGNSPNILHGIEEATSRGLRTVGLTGQSGGKLFHLCEECVRVPSTVTPHIQQAHILVGHTICLIAEEELFEKP
jgi:D-sedoheptulose 7-phosphate isomerase